MNTIKMKEKIEQLEKELAELKKQLDNNEHKFKIGDWVFVENIGSQINNGNHFIGSQKGSVYRISRLDYDSGKASKRDPRYVSEEGYNNRGKDLRKATPEEIENALIKEAKRRGYHKYRFIPDNILYMIGRPEYVITDLTDVRYFHEEDKLWAQATNGNWSAIIYKNGEWADVIKDTKFFEWDVEEQTYVIKIGCETFTKNFLRDFKEAISKLDNGITISELTDELKKLDL